LAQVLGSEASHRHLGCVVCFEDVPQSWWGPGTAIRDVKAGAVDIRRLLVRAMGTSANRDRPVQQEAPTNESSSRQFEAASASGASDVSVVRFGDASVKAMGLRGRRFVLSSSQDVARARAGGGCSICTFDLAQGEHVIELHCQHLFHSECLETWLLKQPTCPLCRCEALDVGLVVDRLVAEMHEIGGGGRHHHDLLPVLEQLGSLARDSRFVHICAQSCGCLAQVAEAHPCPMVRGLVLDLFLVFSQKEELHLPINEARGALFPVLEKTLQHERPPLRAVSCGIIWNLAIPSSRAQSDDNLKRFMAPVAKMIEDEDPVVAHRAARALWFLVQAPDRVQLLMRSDLLTPLLRRVSQLDTTNEDLAFLLQTLTHCMEQEVIDEAVSIHLHSHLFKYLPIWLTGHSAVRMQALHSALILSRFQSEEQMPAWHALYEDCGALGLLLNGRPPEGDETFDITEARAHVIGITWNLALNKDWRRPLADWTLAALLRVVEEGETLDSVSRERLMTALWLLSKDAHVASCSRWMEAVDAICGQVELLEGTVQIHGLELLDNLREAQGGPIASKMMPWLWHLITGDLSDAPMPLAPLFSLFLGLSTLSATKEWLWQCEGAPKSLATALGSLGGSAMRSARDGKEQLVGVIWNLSMDEVPGHREALGSAILPLAPDLLGDASFVVVSRTCTALFHLTKSPQNAALLRSAGTASKPLEDPLVKLFVKVDDEDLRLQAGSVLFALCSQSDELGIDAFNCRVSSRMLHELASTRFFDSTDSDDISEKGSCPSLRVVGVALRLLVLFSASARVCADLMSWRPTHYIVRFIDPRMVSTYEREARAHAIGIMWNLAVTDHGAYCRQVADLALVPLLTLALAEKHEGGGFLDTTTRNRLTMALFFLSRSEEVAKLAPWAQAAEALHWMANMSEGEMLVYSVEIIANLRKHAVQCSAW